MRRAGSFALLDGARAATALSISAELGLLRVPSSAVFYEKREPERFPIFSCRRAMATKVGPAALRDFTLSIMVTIGTVAL